MRRPRRGKLTSHEIQAIKQARVEGITERELIERFGWSKGSIWRAVHWKPRPVAVEWQARSGRLRLADRLEIAVGLRGGDTFTAIARQLHVSISTVSREVGGMAARSAYDPAAAHQRAQHRTRRPKRRRLEGNTQLAERVLQDLRWWWSPQQIAARLRVDFPTTPEMWVSHETIYTSLFVQGNGALRKELAACLRTGRAARRERRTGTSRAALSNVVPISERPAEAEDRAVPGHWEGDLVFGRGHTHAIGTLVERSTRYVVLFKPASYKAEDVRVAMTAAVQTLPRELFKTLAWDRGAEMARHKQFSIDTGVQVYFCDPRSPWQRGMNENTNGLLRQYFPKGSDFSLLTEEDLAEAAASLNNRPRQTLHWLKPAEALAELLALTG